MVVLPHGPLREASNGAGKLGPAQDYQHIYIFYIRFRAVVLPSDPFARMYAPRRERHDWTMGKLIDGQWSTEWYKADDKGHFVREETKFRGAVTADGSSGFRAEPERYHLYVSLACPWAHRTLVARALKGLEDAIS